MHEKSYKKIFIHYIGYVMIKGLKYTKISYVNPLYLIINKTTVYFEEINKYNYLRLGSINGSN